MTGGRNRDGDVRKLDLLSRIQNLTSKINQVCQDICDIKLRRLLVTCSDMKPDDITNHFLTNRNDHKDTWDSNKNKSDPRDIHEGHAEDGNDYAYGIPNHLELGNRNNLKDHEICPPQPRPIPSGMTPEPLPYPDPSEASERSSLPPVSLSSPPKKDDIEPDASSMYTEKPDLSWSLCLAPAKKNGGGVGDEGGDRTNEGRGLPLSRV